MQLFVYLPFNKVLPNSIYIYLYVSIWLENALDNEHFKTFFEFVIRVKSQGFHTPTFWGFNH